MIMENKKALEERRARKGKKPRFHRQDAHKRVKLKSGWRRPKGLQSKMRLKKRGYARNVSDGWGSPRAVEGLTRAGLRPIHIATIAQIDKLNPKTDCAIFVSTLGGKKREQLLLRAKERGVAVLSVKDIAVAVASLRERVASRLAAKKERTVKTKKTIEQKVEKAEVAVKASKDVDTAKSDGASDDASKAQEEEKRKVLTKKV